MSFLKVEDLTKAFLMEKSKIQVLENASFTVQNDEFVCLVGPSGCGKSTVLRIIAGLEKADSGRILFHGQPITQPTPKISMVFQLFGLLPWKTALENVELPLEVQGVRKENQIRIAKEYLKKVELEAFEDTYPHDLSGGMKQRVGIARALALQPELLLMDEPFSSLDELTAKTLRGLVLDAWRDRRTPPDSILMVSHNVEEAVYMADRVVVMSPRPGKIIGEVKIGIPRPRIEHIREDTYFSLVDKVLEVLQKGKTKIA